MPEGSLVAAPLALIGIDPAVAVANAKAKQAAAKQAAEEAAAAGKASTQTHRSTDEDGSKMTTGLSDLDAVTQGQIENDAKVRGCGSVRK